MKNTKTKIVLPAIIFLAVIGFVGIANATTASLYVSPATLTKIAGDAFNVSVGFNASGNKVCAVEGTLVFNNLTCQSITMAADVTPQSSPTCANPHFLIGVPSCATVNKALLTVSVKAGSAGAASVGLTGVDVIGEGVSVGSASAGSNYTINAVVVPQPTPTPAPSPAPVSTPKPNPIPMPAPKTKIVQENSQPAPEQPAEQPIAQPVEQPAVQNLPVANIGGFLTLGTGSVWAGIIAIIVLVIVVCVVCILIQRKRKNSGKK
ncbi:MAG: hypothetical protein NTZ42_04470 [Candidatus Gribaldobacteria bacterium]|nr:hypothetical protein [Candidatus Gribaldobacteria bacterium]